MPSSTEGAISKLKLIYLNVDNQIGSARTQNLPITSSTTKSSLNEMYICALTYKMHCLINFRKCDLTGKLFSLLFILNYSKSETSDLSIQVQFHFNNRLWYSLGSMLHGVLLRTCKWRETTFPNACGSGKKYRSSDQISNQHPLGYRNRRLKWGSELEQVLCIPLRVVRGDWMGRPFRWDRKYRGPMSQQVWHDKDPSLLKGVGRQT
jgi:hypothetical protein